jgi:DNA-binding transcriptional LysR family regulator
MDTDHLKIFAEVVRQGSFAAAARAMDIDPSAATRAIASLERDLGLRLLQRTTRQLVLTEAGHKYHDNTCRLLNDLQQAADEARDVAGSAKGVVRVTASVTYGYAVLLPLLPLLRRTFPLLEVDLLLSDEVVDLLTERVDVALRLRQEDDTSLIGTRLAKIRYRVVATPLYLNQHGAPSSPSDLLGRDCLRCSVRDYRTDWKFRSADKSVQTIEVKGWLFVSNSLTLHRATFDHLGPALLPDWLIKSDLASGALVDLFPDYDVTPTDFDNAVWLLYASRSYIPNRVRAFVDFMKAHIRGPSSLNSSSSGAGVETWARTG